MFTTLLGFFVYFFFLFFSLFLLLFLFFVIPCISDNDIFFVLPYFPWYFVAFVIIRKDTIQQQHTHTHMHIGTSTCARQGRAPIFLACTYGTYDWSNACACSAWSIWIALCTHPREISTALWISGWFYVYICKGLERWLAPLHIYI